MIGPGKEQTIPCFKQGGILYQSYDEKADLLAEMYKNVCSTSNCSPDFQILKDNFENIHQNFINAQDR